MKFIHGQQQVPCLFFYGDSQFDNGNNNLLITLAKANYLPYGIDYPEVQPQFLGFDNPIPPFVTARGSDILKGVNYASGAAGILDESGILQGDRFTMNRQLLNHRITIGRIGVLLRNNQTTVDDYLNQCLYVVNMGSNDYLNNYFLPVLSPARLLYTPDRFAEILVQKFSQQLRTLYNSGARKVAVFGVGLLGCLPQELANFPTNGSACVDFINNAAQLFNNRLIPLIDDLNNNLPDAQFIYVNITSISLGDPSAIGVRVTNVPCCVVRRTTGLCAPNQVPCSNRNEYTFWDNFHPTQILNRATASRAYTATLPSDAYPFDIRTLVQQ
ncbi:hypothetical protein DH2020_042024 [Rehmannia glutinosa]|uniref:GDSL esterase/lipase n=1 Tax=Rehmannia glutinosa TaxID=99300 RepID=A0ABR0UQ18_REHGL